MEISGAAAPLQAGAQLNPIAIPDYSELTAAQITTSALVKI
jgi:hypothetical protein